MILAPHADDESLGCGGLIAECCRTGRTPIVVILTDGAASHPGSEAYPPFRLSQVREAEALAAVRELGLDPGHLIFLRYPDAALPSDTKIVAKVSELLREFGCSVLFAPWIYDPHCDHEAAAIVARRSAEINASRLFFYPVWGWLLPNDNELPVESAKGWRLDIADHLAAKRRAITSHRSQYSDLIDDSPEGFRLPEKLLTVFEKPYEVFLEP